jgi:hypothetical protein
MCRYDLHRALRRSSSYFKWQSSRQSTRRDQRNQNHDKHLQLIRYGETAKKSPPPRNPASSRDSSSDAPGASSACSHHCTLIFGGATDGM